VSVVEQHVKIFACDGCKVESEQEPVIAQIEGWVRLTSRGGSSTTQWDFCSWECAGEFIADGEPDTAGVVIEDNPGRRGRRYA
jgi:hypothetical protein